MLQCSIVIYVYFFIIVNCDHTYVSSLIGIKGGRVGDSLTHSSCCRALHGPSWNRLIVGFLNKNLMDSFIDIQMKRKSGKTTPAQSLFVVLTCGSCSCICD